MSIFGSIMSKIFGHATAAPTTPPSPGTESPGAAAIPGTPAQPVDVGAVLADLQSKTSQKLNYETSIVDLMKLLGLDSNSENRRSLATELHFPGDMNDSASMNVWLHKQVMDKLAENGGTVPAELRG